MPSASRTHSLACKVEKGNEQSRHRSPACLSGKNGPATASYCARVKTHRRDCRPRWNQSGRRKVLLTVRERDGNSVPAVSIRDARLLHSRFTREDTVARADEAVSRDHLHERFEVEGIKHQAAYSLDGACADMAAHDLNYPDAEGAIHGHVAGSCFFRFTQQSTSRAQGKRSLALSGDALDSR